MPLPEHSLIREALASDLADLMVIYNHAIEHSVATFDLVPFDEIQARAWFDRFDGDRAVLLSAVLRDRVVGFAFYAPHRPKPGYRHARETTVYIHPDYLGHGIGTALYTALIARARDTGAHALVAVIAGDNPASVSLHRKFGYEPVGTFPEMGRKFGRWIDATHYHMVLDDMVQE
jgi:phosphinothricin acetyltransferase